MTSDPYTTKTFESVYSDIGGAWKIVRYISSDPITAVTSAGYVTDAREHRLTLGDLVYVTDPSVGTLFICKVAAISGNAATLSQVDLLVPSQGGTERTVSTSGTLLLTDSIVLVNNNTGSSLALTQPVGSSGVQTILIVDVAGTAGTNPITWTGTVGGDTNPTLIDVDLAFAEVMWTGSAWIRIR